MRERETDRQREREAGVSAKRYYERMERAEEINESRYRREGQREGKYSHTL